MVRNTPTDSNDTPLPRDKHDRKRSAGGKSMLAPMLRLAVVVELHATGRVYSDNPLVGGIAWLTTTRELQPLTACVLAYSRLVDIHATRHTVSASLARREKSSKQLAIQQAKRQAKLKRHGGAAAA